MKEDSPSFQYIFKTVVLVVLSLVLIGVGVSAGWHFLVTLPKEAAEREAIDAQRVATDEARKAQEEARRAAEEQAAAEFKAYEEVAKNIGSEATVTGVVAQVSVKPSITFLNFNKPYPSNTFTVIIRSRYTNEFDDLPKLKGKSVAVRGKVIDYNGKIEMELTTKSQLKVLENTK